MFCLGQKDPGVFPCPEAGVEGTRGALPGTQQTLWAALGLVPLPALDKHVCLKPQCWEWDLFIFLSTAVHWGGLIVVQGTVLCFWESPRPGSFPLYFFPVLVSFVMWMTHDLMKIFLGSSSVPCKEHHVFVMAGWLPCRSSKGSAELLLEIFHLLNWAVDPV